MGKEFLSCRDVLWMLVFCGFAINYMLRINLNLAIVAMVFPRTKAAAASQCSTFQNNHNQSQWNETHHNDSPYINSTENFQKKTTEELYDWDEYEQGLALGAYYWLHWVTQLPGGLLARKYGTKKVFGIGNFATAVLGLFIPIATQYNFYGLVAIRVVQGLISGVIWPSMHDMTAKWIPAIERSRFVSAYLGSSVGAAITYPLCAVVINDFGWSSAFYITSLIGVVWFIFWQVLVFDTPHEHPRISHTERKHIIENIGATVSSNNDLQVPWSKLLLSGPLWITIVAHWGGVWGFLTFMTQAPSYFNFVHGWNINTTGILSGLPHVLRMIFSYFYSSFSDWLLRTERMTLKNVRKLANFVMAGGGAILTLGLSFSGCQPLFAIFFMMTGTAINGAVSAGTLASLVDLSPNFASVLFGFCGLMTAAAGFISPLIVGILTNHRQTIEQWRLVFIIASINLSLSAIVYTIFGTSDVQTWNGSVESEENANKEIIQKLQQKENIEENSKSEGENKKKHSAV